jgi:hypothetical protein
MRTHIIEATNGMLNWGKFILMIPDTEWERTAATPGCDSQTSLLAQRGWNRDKDIIVFDLQTCEGAAFSLGGSASRDLEKHRIWVCPLFEPFLTWLYGEPRDKVMALDLPTWVDLPKAAFAFSGHRRSGPVDATHVSPSPATAAGLVAPEDVVHALYQGRTYCGAIPPLPRGHVWVRFDDVRHVTCAACIAVGAGEPSPA